MFYSVSVNTIAVAKPDKAQMVESMLIQVAQPGQTDGLTDRHTDNGYKMYYSVPVNTIAVAKPDKAQMVDSMLIQVAQPGQTDGLTDR